MPNPVFSDAGASLIAKLSEAKEGNRELDLLVYNYVTGGTRGPFFTLSLEELNAHDERQLEYVLRYTTSIDAALKLLPEGWTRSVDATAPEAGIDVDLYAPMPAESTLVDQMRNRIEEPAIGSHVVEAIATCIAIVKALERCRALTS